MNLHCDLDLQNNNLIFTQISPAYDDVPSNKMWLQKDQQFSKYGKTVILDYMSPHYNPELEDSKPIFLHDTLAGDDPLPYQVWLQKVQQLRRNHPAEHSQKF